MDQLIKRYVGLDVHKDTVSVSVCEAGREASRLPRPVTVMPAGC
jgi:hypothetical protein